MDDAPSWHPVLIPAGPIDGAVVELQVRPDGLVTAERCIPAPQPEVHGALADGL